MGRSSSGGGGARGGSTSGASKAESSVSARVAGYADLVTPPNVKISPSGPARMSRNTRKPKAGNGFRTNAVTHCYITTCAQGPTGGPP